MCKFKFISICFGYNSYIVTAALIMTEEMENMMVKNDSLCCTEHEQVHIDTGGWKTNTLFPYFEYVSMLFEKFHDYHSE